MGTHGLRSGALFGLLALFSRSMLSFFGDLGWHTARTTLAGTESTELASAAIDQVDCGAVPHAHF